MLPAFVSRVCRLYCLVDCECPFILAWTLIGLFLTVCPIFISAFLYNQSVSKLGLRRDLKTEKADSCGLLIPAYFGAHYHTPCYGSRVRFGVLTGVFMINLVCDDMSLGE